MQVKSFCVGFLEEGDLHLLSESTGRAFTGLLAILRL
jgi:hypothetical protein